MGSQTKVFIFAVRNFTEQNFQVPENGETGHFLTLLSMTAHHGRSGAIKTRSRELTSWAASKDIRLTAPSPVKWWGIPLPPLYLCTPFPQQSRPPALGLRQPSEREGRPRGRKTDSTRVKKPDFIPQTFTKPHTVQVTVAVNLTELLIKPVIHQIKLIN